MSSYRDARSATRRTFLLSYPTQASCIRPEAVITRLKFRFHSAWSSIPYSRIKIGFTFRHRTAKKAMWTSTLVFHSESSPTRSKLNCWNIKISKLKFSSLLQINRNTKQTQTMLGVKHWRLPKPLWELNGFREGNSTERGNAKRGSSNTKVEKKQQVVQWKVSRQFVFEGGESTKNHRSCVRRLEAYK